MSNMYVRTSRAIKAVGKINIRAKILLATFFAATVIFCFARASSTLSGWLLAMNAAALYKLLNVALWAVIIGVVVEEYELLWKGVKFFRLVFSGRYGEAFTKTRLHVNEIVEGVGFIILVVGLASELAVQPLIEAQQEVEQANLRGRAATALDDAAKANNKAAELLKENTELEHALAPRDINEFPLAKALISLQRVPLFVSSLDREEPKEVAMNISSSFKGIQIGDSTPWGITTLAPESWDLEGVSVQFASVVSNPNKGASETAAVAICENLKQQGIVVGVKAVPLNSPQFSIMWPLAVPVNAVVIRVGAKPNHFWENKARRAKGLDAPMDFNFCTSDELFESAQKAREARLQKHKAEP